MICVHFGAKFNENILEPDGQFNMSCSATRCMMQTRASKDNTAQSQNIATTPDFDKTCCLKIKVLIAGLG